MPPSRIFVGIVAAAAAAAVAAAATPLRRRPSNERSVQILFLLMYLPT